jgi:calcineurin-like phosphoesterase family protein
MSERFLIADTHFTQASMCAFARDDGSPLRPWGRPVPGWKTMSAEERADLLPEFERRAAEMDEAMVENWNRVVGPKDKVEHLGDVVTARRHLPILGRLNGKKRLRLGNHDPFLKDYGRYFDEVSAYKIMDDLVLTHIPIHEDSLKERWRACVHGHLHDGRVMTYAPGVRGSYDMAKEETAASVHPRYLCVSVEHIDYTPISLDDVYARIALQQ